MLLYAIIVLIHASTSDKQGRWEDSGVYTRTLEQCMQLVDDTKHLQPQYTYGCKAIKVGK